MMTSGLGEARLDVAVDDLDAARDVRRRLWLWLDARGEHVVVQHRRAGLHRFVDVGDMGQHFVIDIDQAERLGRDTRVGRGDGGHRVALVERFVARHDVGRDPAQLVRPPRRS